GFLECMVRQSEDRVFVATRHGLRGHQRVDDRLLRRLHRRLEQRVHRLIMGGIGGFLPGSGEERGQAATLPTAAARGRVAKPWRRKDLRPVSANGQGGATGTSWHHRTPHHRPGERPAASYQRKGECERVLPDGGAVAGMWRRGSEGGTPRTAGRASVANAD